MDCSFVGLFESHDENVDSDSDNVGTTRQIVFPTPKPVIDVVDVKVDHERNKTMFSMFSTKELKVSYEISNIYVRKVYEYCFNYGHISEICDIQNKISIIIQANEYNSAVQIIMNRGDKFSIITSEFKKIIADFCEYLKQYKNIVHISLHNFEKKIEPNIVVTGPYKDSIDDYVFERTYNSFNQPENNIRKYVHQFVKNICHDGDIHLFGGEMYIYQHYFPESYISCVTDNKVIADDTLRNGKSNTQCINSYSDLTSRPIDPEILKTIQKKIKFCHKREHTASQRECIEIIPSPNSIGIFNISKNGLGFVFSSFIAGCEFKKIYIIGCKSYIYQTEIDTYLSKFYTQIRTHNISINGGDDSNTVCIYELEKK